MPDSSQVPVNHYGSAPTLVGEVPEGWDARVLARLAGDHTRVLHVCRDDARLDSLARALAYFAPDLEVLRIPAWDCLPYDRSSPDGFVVSQRVDSLARLAAWPVARPLVVLTTANAVLQRVPPGSFFAGSSLQVRVGASCPIEQVQAFLENNGYQRTGTVREPGEYAIRGGLVDLFPSGSTDPLRLDFFGDEIEEIREFDPMSQKSTGTLEALSLSPASELLLTREGIQRFRTGYRGHFGAQVSDDPLYQAVSEGRRHQGVEHWLPLFHEALETVFDHVGDACVAFDNHAGDVLSTRFEMIAEYYETRRVAHERATGDAAIYRPLPPGLLHVDPAEWQDMVAERKVYRFCGPGELPPVDAFEVLHAGAQAGVNLVEARVNPDRALQAEAVEAVHAALDAGERVLLTGHSDGSCARITSLVREAGVTDVEQVGNAAEFEGLAAHVVGVAVLPFENGFRAEGTLYITETDVLGERQSRPARRRRRAGEDFLRDAAALSEGDHVVHADYGVARYEGLETLDLGGAAHDCLKLLYADDDRLYVPVENIEILSRYGSSDSLVQLDRLGSAAWQARKSRVMDRLRDMADELIRIAAQRQVQSLARMVPPPGLYDEFCSGFLHDETEDQLRAIGDSLDDLSRGRPMDRLICGDVGFGKTEVALRAAMVAVMDGFQVAVVAPTTLLARQHHVLFSQRFAGLPVTVRQLSRLVRPKEAADTRRMIANGTCSIVIGTHAVLAKSVRFDNLGLLVVDEEQRFGVAQKERLKQLRSDVHVLTLTATPIPRTLQLALTGVRDLSIIGTPPVDRLSVRTFVTSWDPVVVREALQRERNRGGQSFCVCPRVRDLPEMYDRLVGLVPDAKIATAHGQMRPAELEEVMTGFLDGASDILLCTNIIESGLDIPSANTIIVHRAEMFGLAQLYQLRGRVGRSKTRAYAYLTTGSRTRRLPDTARRRLAVMRTLDTLGAGFSLASHDMDIRGAGNLLGKEQSGQVRDVGIELYQHLLQEAVMAAREDRDKGAAVLETWMPQISLGIPVLIPESYVRDLSARLALYRRVSRLTDNVELGEFAEELVDRFGPVPEETTNLMELMTIRLMCRKAGIEKVDAGPKGGVVGFRETADINPSGLVDLITRERGTVQLRPDHSLVFRRNWHDPHERVRGVKRVIRDLRALVGQ
ncbi:MAG: transcription-repair coupling factor [Alphaproteobacteria bacterium]|nr:transcription-repair coupling factor [Alphaproteobacteria bacterium]